MLNKYYNTIREKERIYMHIHKYRYAHILLYCFDRVDVFLNNNKISPQTYDILDINYKITILTIDQKKNLKTKKKQSKNV